MNEHETTTRDPLEFVTYNPSTGLYTMTSGISADLGHRALTMAIRRKNGGDSGEPLPTKAEDGSLILNMIEADAVVESLALIAHARRQGREGVTPSMQLADILSTAFLRASAAAILWPSHERETTTLEQLQTMEDARANIELLAALAADVNSPDPITV
jgi:hypothetical protein